MLHQLRAWETSQHYFISEPNCHVTWELTVLNQPVHLILFSKNPWLKNIIVASFEEDGHDYVTVM